MAVGDAIVFQGEFIVGDTSGVAGAIIAVGFADLRTYAVVPTVSNTDIFHALRVRFNHASELSAFGFSIADSLNSFVKGARGEEFIFGATHSSSAKNERDDTEMCKSIHSGSAFCELFDQPVRNHTPSLLELCNNSAMLGALQVVE